MVTKETQFERNECGHWVIECFGSFIIKMIGHLVLIMIIQESYVFIESFGIFDQNGTFSRLITF